MSTIQYSKIQHRRGLLQDLPMPLNASELGHAIDEGRVFIGNGAVIDGAVSAGNTELITDLTLLYNPKGLKYTYKSNTAITAVTKALPNDPASQAPVIRALGEILDDHVSVKAYGAKGDGIQDDAPYIQQALNDLYCQLQPNPTAQQVANRQLFFPAGVYNLASKIYIPPFASLIGEGGSLDKPIDFFDAAQAVAANKTVIRQLSSLEDAVVSTQDSLGQRDVSIGTSGATTPKDIFVYGITFQYRPTDNTSANSDVVHLERASDVLFENCGFVGNWLNNDSSPSIFAAIRTQSLGTVYKNSNIKAKNCSFVFVKEVFNSNDSEIGTSEIQFESCTTAFTLYGIRSTANDNNIKVSNSIFTNVLRTAIVAHRLSSNTSSLNNTFRECGSPVYPVILFDALFSDQTFAKGCSSIGDRFIDCAGKPVSDLGFAMADHSTNIGGVIHNNVGNSTFQTMKTTSRQDAIQINPGSGTTVFGLEDGIPGIPLSVANTVFIDYTLTVGSNRRVGRMFVFSDGDPSGNGTIFSDLASELAETGIEFNATPAGNILYISYSSTNVIPAIWFTQAKAWFTPTDVLTTPPPPVPPTITNIVPSSGTVAGGDTVTITGSNFTLGMGVVFGSHASTSVSIIDATTVTALVPAHVSGPLAVDVSVTTGSGSATLVGGYTYVPVLPALTSITPTSGSEIGGDVITLTGTGFINGMTVTFGSTLSALVTVVNQTTATAVVPAYTSGPSTVDVIATTIYGSDTLANAFTYIPEPIESYTLTNDSNQVALASGNLQDMAMNPTGTIAVVMFGSTLTQYTLSTPYDFTTATISGTFSTASQSADPGGNFAITPDGLHLYRTSVFSPANIYQYSMSTPWDITTAGFVHSASISALSPSGTQPNAMTFSANGQSMYFDYTGSGTGGSDVIAQFHLNTAYDITTINPTPVFVTPSLFALIGPPAVTSTSIQTYGMTFNSDGTHLFIAGYPLGDFTGHLCWKFDLSTAYDLSTLAFDANSVLDLGNGVGYLGNGLAVNSDETKFIWAGDAQSTGNVIRRYSMNIV